MVEGADPELSLIGSLIGISRDHAATALDAKAWLRVRDYAISLFEQRAREANEATGQTVPIIPAPKAWHVLGRRRKPRTLNA